MQKEKEKEEMHPNGYNAGERKKISVVLDIQQAVKYEPHFEFEKWFGPIDGKKEKIKTENWVIYNENEAKSGQNTHIKTEKIRF